MLSFCCHVCDRPLPGGSHFQTGWSLTLEFCSIICQRGFLDHDEQVIQERRRSACEEGHHRTPGWPGHAEWTTDPADPYGDASFWECTKGCGHVQHHAGYGINKAIYERVGPVEFAKYRQDPAGYRPPEPRR